MISDPKKARQMKKTTTYIFRYCIVACLLLLSATACNWLDIDPNLGVDEEEVFGSYKNIRSYFNYAFSTYENHLTKNSFMGSAMEEECGNSTVEDSYTLDGTTDIADQGRKARHIEYKQCNLSWDAVSSRNTSEKPISKAMWNCIRIANKTIKALPDITDCTESERNEIFGYAYYLRAYAHFVLCRRFGGVPYITEPFGADDEWDLERLDSWTTYQECAKDFYTAYQYLEKAGWMRRDGLPGEEGHLNSPTSEFPCGVGALAFRARALVYAASPLSNKNGKEDWKQAADACAEALKAAEQWKYSLVTFDRISSLFLSSGASVESIAFRASSRKDSNKWFRSYFTYPQSYCSGASGLCPTQNFVDLYETRWGDPLDTEEARLYAQSIGHYNPQDPYADLDPRFEATIVHDGSTNQYVTGAINIYRSSTGKWPSTSISGEVMEFGKEWGTTDQDGNGYSVTGYYCKKYWEGQVGTKGAAHGHVDNIFRLGELYLLYAEAVNEAYGPSGKAGGYDKTAIEAVNFIRSRSQMPAVQSRFTADTDSFRTRIQNERTVELAFEAGHYYYDIRRWMTAPQRMGRNKMYGMYITETAVSGTYPNGRIYERKALPETRQCTWKDCMYYFPFAKEQANKMVLFKNNEIWH